MKPSNLRPFFAYLSESQYAALKQFAKQTGVSMTHLIREGIDQPPRAVTLARRMTDSGVRNRNAGIGGVRRKGPGGRALPLGARESGSTRPCRETSTSASGAPSDPRGTIRDSGQRELPCGSCFSIRFPAVAAGEIRWWPVGRFDPRARALLDSAVLAH